MLENLQKWKGNPRVLESQLKTVRKPESFYVDFKESLISHSPMANKAKDQMENQIMGNAELKYKLNKEPQQVSNVKMVYIIWVLGRKEGDGWGLLELDNPENCKLPVSSEHPFSQQQQPLLPVWATWPSLA